MLDTTQIVHTPHANDLVHRDHRAHLRLGYGKRLEDRRRSAVAVVRLLMAASIQTMAGNVDDDAVGVETKC
jgi:hypothetical protein